MTFMAISNGPILYLEDPSYGENIHEGSINEFMGR